MANHPHQHLDRPKVVRPVLPVVSFHHHQVEIKLLLHQVALVLFDRVPVFHRHTIVSQGQPVAIRSGVILLQGKNFTIELDLLPFFVNCIDFNIICLSVGNRHKHHPTHHQPTQIGCSFRLNSTNTKLNTMLSLGLTTYGLCVSHSKIPLRKIVNFAWY